MALKLKFIPPVINPEEVKKKQDPFEFVESLIRWDNFPSNPETKVMVRFFSKLADKNKSRAYKSL